MFIICQPIGQTHFQGRLDFLDLFLRTDVSSASRARAFLWLCFNYLESPSSDDDYDEESSPNPFSDSNNKFSAPPFSFLTAKELETENRETAEDLVVTEKLMTQRSRIVQHHGTKETGKPSAKASVNDSVLGDDEEMAAPAPEEPKGRGKRSAPATSAKAKRAPIVKEMKPTTSKETPPTKHLADVDEDEDEEDDNLIDAFVKRKWSS